MLSKPWLIACSIVFTVVAAAYSRWLHWLHDQVGNWVILTLVPCFAIAIWVDTRPSVVRHRLARAGEEWVGEECRQRLGFRAGRLVARTCARVFH